MSEPISTLLNAPVVPTVKAVEFDWESNNMEMQSLVCRRHPNIKYLTKHLWDRSLHLISFDGTECSCPIEYLVVVKD